MTLRFLFLFTLFLSFFEVAAQPKDLLDEYPSSDFHQGRRAALRALLPNKSVAVIFSNPVRNRSNDVDYEYHQDPNMYYLSGYTEPHGLLLIFKEPRKIYGKTVDEVLFVQKRDDIEEMWNGKRLGVEGAQDKLMFKLAMNGDQFEHFELDFSDFDKILFENFTDDVRDHHGEADLYDLINVFKKKISYDLVSAGDASVGDHYKRARRRIDIKSLSMAMAQLREVKTPEELKLLKKAVEISAIGQLEMMKAMHPNMSELEAQGVHEFIYKKYGAAHEGYPSIVGAGNNGCILHYIDNNKLNVGDNQLVLMDLGAEYMGYTADVTRTIPANGKFTKEQKLIYDLVYEAQEAGIKAAAVGNSFNAPSKITKRIINNGLAKLGIIERPDSYHMYYPHGSTHHIGLDVHDPGTYGDFKENMVVTVEPGIYIPEGSDCDEKWWGIAVRIEDDILITNNGPINLSARAPRKSDEIEAAMLETSILDKFKLPKLD